MNHPRSCLRVSHHANDHRCAPSAPHPAFAGPPSCQRPSLCSIRTRPAPGAGTPRREARAGQNLPGGARRHTPGPRALDPAHGAGRRRGIGRPSGAGSSDGAARGTLHDVQHGQLSTRCRNPYVSVSGNPVQPKVPEIATDPLPHTTHSPQRHIFRRSPTASKEVPVPLTMGMSANCRRCCSGHLAWWRGGCRRRGDFAAGNVGVDRAC